MYVCMYVSVCVCVCVRMYVSVCMYVCIDAWLYLYIVCMSGLTIHI